MLPKLIDSWETLPRVTESYLQERVSFDLKATYAPKSHAEKAKDIAAFANAIGGALIVGAKEGPTEPDYSSPLALEYAAAIESEFDEAVRDYCCPSPVVHIRSIPVTADPTKVILVVNIEAEIDQPVAARHDGQPKLVRNCWPSNAKLRSSCPTLHYSALNLTWPSLTLGPRQVNARSLGSRICAESES